MNVSHFYEKPAIQEMELESVSWICDSFGVDAEGVSETEGSWDGII